MSARWPHALKPCPECPWRRDVAPGRFPPERFVALAPTAYDMATSAFACHKAPEGREFACAGFLLKGAAHNLSVRMAAVSDGFDWRAVGDGGFPLFDSYREMAEANGVDPDDPILAPCRRPDR